MTDTSALRLPESAECALCDYLLGRRPYTVWFKEPLIAGLVTREQRGVSHVLVLPVRHCPTILDLSEQESAALMDGIRRDLAKQRGSCPSNHSSFAFSRRRHASRWGHRMGARAGIVCG
jgi:hypothetical protein